MLKTAGAVDALLLSLLRKSERHARYFKFIAMRRVEVMHLILLRCGYLSKIRPSSRRSCPRCRFRLHFNFIALTRAEVVISRNLIIRRLLTNFDVKRFRNCHELQFWTNWRLGGLSLVLPNREIQKSHAARVCRRPRFPYYCCCCCSSRAVGPRLTLHGAIF